MAEPIISVSGLRGIVGETLTPEVVVRYTAAFAALAPSGTLLVSRDGRAGGDMIRSLVIGSLQAAGRRVVDVGIAATPTVGVLVRECEAAGAVQITASHNPPEYNGLKLFSPEGRVIPKGPGESVLKWYRERKPVWSRYSELGQASRLTDNISAHLDAVLATVDVERIRQRHFHVVLDSNHGAGSILGVALLEELGCRVVPVGDIPDGAFEHPPEPIAENLVSITSIVREVGADLGFCQDPDADRLAVIDAEGNYLGEEYTLAICVDHVLKRRKGPIVANCATSRMSADTAAKYGVPFYRSAVGEANVVDSMLANHAVFGGEGNGGPIDPEVGLVRDSFVGMAQILDAMAAEDATVAALAARLPKYSIVKEKYPLKGAKLERVFATLRAKFPEAQCDDQDGLRLDWPDRWLLVRPSNTEPIVRAIAEAEDAAHAKTLCEAAAEAIRQSVE
ncbi:phosphoglucosamine mutase [Thermostilla marina]